MDAKSGLKSGSKNGQKMDKKVGQKMVQKVVHTVVQKMSIFCVPKQEPFFAHGAHSNNNLNVDGNGFNGDKATRMIQCIILN